MERERERETSPPHLRRKEGRTCLAHRPPSLRHSVSEPHGDRGCLHPLESLLQLLHHGDVRFGVIPRVRDSNYLLQRAQIEKDDHNGRCDRIGLFSSSRKRNRDASTSTMARICRTFVVIAFSETPPCDRLPDCSTQNQDGNIGHLEKKIYHLKFSFFFFSFCLTFPLSRTL